MRTTAIETTKSTRAKGNAFNVLAITLLAVGLLSSSVFAEGKCGDADECLQAIRESIAKRGWLGIEYDTNEENGLPEIHRVLAESPAEKGGLQTGDFLLTINGASYQKGREEVYAEVKKSLVPGNEISFEVRRDDELVEVTVVAGEMPPAMAAQLVGRHMMEYHKNDAESESDTADDSDKR